MGIALGMCVAPMALAIVTSAPASASPQTVVFGTPAVGSGGSYSLSVTYSANGYVTMPTVSDSAGDTFTLTVSNSGTAGCSFNTTFTEVIYTSAGSCTITATASGADKDSGIGSGDGNGSGTGTLSVTVVPASQAITFTSTAPSPALAGTTYNVAATGGASGNPVIFSIDAASTSGCTVLSGVVTFSGPAGTCVVDANQAGTTNYLAATQAQQSISVTKQVQTIAAPSSGTVEYSSAITYAITGVTTNGGGTILFSSSSTTCSVNSTSGVVSNISAGVCSVSISASGTTNYLPATPVTFILTVTSPPVIAPPVIPPPPPLHTLTITATSQSVQQGGSVSIGATVFGAASGDTASVSSVTITFTGAGSTAYGPSTAAPSLAGTYSVTPSGGAVLISPAGDQANYSTSYSYASGSLVITPAPVVIPVSPPKAPKPPKPVHKKPVPRPRPVHHVAPTRYVLIKSFGEGSFALTANLQRQIMRMAREIKKAHYRIIELAGYTDNVFTPAFNVILVHNRARVVWAQLTRDLRALRVRGVTIAIVPGLTVQLIDSNTTPIGRAFNRRVVATLKAS